MTTLQQTLLYNEYVNPDYVSLLSSLGFYRNFTQAQDCLISDDKGVEYLDFLAGYGVHNIGHNHPLLLQEINEILAQKRPSFLNINAPHEQAVLSKKLCEISNAGFSKTLFCNSGAEAVDTALRLARAATGKSRVISCHNGYHGLTCGALSLMSEKNHRAHFGPLLQGVEHIPFNDSAALEAALKKPDTALFIVEAIQAEGGVHSGGSSFLKEAAQLCKKSKVLFAIDEIQTGLGRTGSFFAAQHYAVFPDIMLIGKALSGGLVPVTAVLMQEPVYKKGVSGMERSYLYHSTFAGGSLAVAAALKTIEILEQENLPELALEKGNYLLEKLQNLAQKHPIIKEVRGKGLLAGIEFHLPEDLLYKTVPKAVRNSLYSYTVASALLNRFHIIAQPCSIAGHVLKLEPPLTVTHTQINQCIEALDNTLDQYPTHHQALMGVARFSLLGQQL